MKKLAIIFLFLLFAGTASATDYYVDVVDGNDANSGATDAPWKTMVRALPNSSSNPKVVAGDTVLLRSGDYGTLNLIYAPTSYSPYPTSWDNKITYKADTGANPFFSGQISSTYKTAIYIAGNYNRYLEFDGINIDVGEAGNDDGIWVANSQSLRFKNMDVNGFWADYAKYGITDCLIKIQRADGMGDFLIENCTFHNGNTGVDFVASKLVGGAYISQPVLSPIIIKDNTFYDISGHPISMDCASGADANKVTIEGNNLYDPKTCIQYYCFDIVDDFNDAWKTKTVTQDGTGATGWVGNYPTIYGGDIQIYPTSSGWNTEPNTTIQGDGFTVTLTSLVHTEPSHLGGIYVRCGNVDIKRNIIRQWGNQSLKLEGGETYEPVATNGYEDVLIENNLVYDSNSDSGGVWLRDLGNRVTIRNNTFIGQKTGSTNGYYYRQAAQLYLKSGKDGTGIKLYNNIFVGYLYLPAAWTVFDENYNLIYAVMQGSLWKTSLAGDHTIIYSTGYTKPLIFDTDFFVDPNYTPHHGIVCDYQLLSGAPAINFGDIDNQPTDSLGSLVDGFIVDDGPARDASHHSAGAYEYDVPPIPATDPYPADDAIDQANNVDLYWSPGDANTINYNVYFGIYPAQTFIGNQDANNYDPGILADNTIYCWRVDANDGSNITIGTVWTFTTAESEESLPSKATNPTPNNYTTGVSTTATLSWTESMGATSRDVYIGTSPDSLEFKGNQVETTYSPTLNYATFYYWRIDAKNSSGTTTGDVWCFRTVNQYDLQNACAAQWKMNEDTNNTLVANSQNYTYGLAIQDTCDINDVGKINGALTFNGTSDFVDTQDTFQSILRAENSDSFSVCGWFKSTDGFRLENFLGTINQAGGGILLYKTVTGQLKFSYYINSGLGVQLTVNSIFTDGQQDWYFIVGTAEQTGDYVKLSLYVNGTLVGTTTGSTVCDMSDCASDLNLYIGGYNVLGSLQFPFDGSIDNVEIFNRILTKSEIRFLWRYGAGTESLDYKSDDDSIRRDLSRRL